MRHFKAGRKLKRTASHRKATLSSLSVSLIRHKRIQTTVAKAKETRKVIERLITNAKNAVAHEVEGGPKNVHARRMAFAYLRQRDAVMMLFNDIAAKVATRPGGYTRVVKLGQRHGDGAEVAMIELVDYNVGQDKAAAKAAAKTAKKPAAGTKGKKGARPKSAKAKTAAATSAAAEPPAKPEPEAKA